MVMAPEHHRPVLIPYLLSWFLLAVVAIANGILRELSYGRLLPERAAHQLSTALCMLFTGVVVWAVSRRWPLTSARQAWLLGTCWLLATIVFEFGFGHFVAGHPWSRLFADYNVLDGRVWLLFLAWVLAMPYVFYRLQKKLRPP